MTDVITKANTIAQLPDAPILDGSEYIAISFGGKTYRATGDQIVSASVDASIEGTVNRITVNFVDTVAIVDIAENYVGQNSIITVGTIGTGVWAAEFGAVSGANLTNLTPANISAGTANINITGSSDTSGSTTGNAATATALQTARIIGGVSFNGTANIVPQTIQTVDDTADATAFVLFGNDSGAQSQQPKTNSAINANLATGQFNATSFSGAGTGLTGTASGLTAGHTTTNANLTGVVTSSGNATSLGSFSSAQLAAALTDETGTGPAVFANSPALVTPNLGVAQATSVQLGSGTVFSVGVEGTYSPTYTNTANISASSATTTYYLQWGKTVFVWGQINVTASAANSASIMGISLPVSATLSDARQLMGTGVDNTGNTNGPMAIYGDTTNNRASVEWVPSVNTARTYSFHFQYRTP